MHLRQKLSFDCSGAQHAHVFGGLAQVCHLVSMSAAAWDVPGFDHTLYFTVTCVAPGGLKCWSCNWTSFCSGCHIEPDSLQVNWEHFESPTDRVQFSIDWTHDAIEK